MYETIVTHNDLDGVASAALCSKAYGVNRIFFAGPVQIQQARATVTARDIVCDLPYPAECALWFDHHQGNLADLEERGLDPASIPGRFAPEKSCARVVYQYLLDEGRKLPDHFAELVGAVDVVDSFDYASVEEWRAETPAHVVANAMKGEFRSPSQRNLFYRNLVYALRDHGLEKVARAKAVRRRYEAYLAEEENMLRLLEQDARPLDIEPSIVLVDLTRHNRKPFVWKNLAQVLYPEALAVVSVECAFRNGRKTNDLGFSMSLTIRQNRSGEPKDVGEIMRALNIGDGHPGAGAGRVSCRSKDEMLRTKDEVLARIVELWRAQGKGDGG
ncbi:hypothetical protein [Deferrisoma palaeochoriense]